MRILFVVTQGEQGGAQKYTLDLVSSFHQQGLDVYVAVGEMENEGDRWLFKELEKAGIKSSNLLEIKTHQREIKLWRDLKSVKDFCNLFAKIYPDVLHLNSSKAGVVGAMSGFLYNLYSTKKLKMIFTVHGFVFLEPMNFLKRIFFIFLEFVSARLRNFTILISEKDISAGKKFKILLGDLGKNYDLVLNGIPNLEDKILSVQEARKYLLDKVGVVDIGQKIVGTVSNLYKTKGLEYLIESAGEIFASQKFPQILFVVFGTGPQEYQQELQNKINNNNLQNNFFLLGRVPDAFKYLSGLDVFTLTSVKEGLPYTLLEAAMANLPIVATSVGGVPEVAKNIRMTLVESKNVEKISQAIIVNLNYPERHKSQFNNIYSLENMATQTLSVYKKIIN